MTGKYNTVTIKHSGHREDTLIIGTTIDETFKIVGNQVLGFKNGWNMDSPLIFVYTLQAGDAAFLGRSDENEELLQRIADLNDEDLAQIRNFMDTAGLGVENK